MKMAAVVTGDKYLEFLVRFVEKQAEQLIEGTLVLKLNPVGLHYVQSRLESLNELEALLAGAPVDYLRAYVSDLGDHRALEQLRRILRLLTSLKVVSVLPSPVRDPTPLSLLPFGRLKALELRGCDLSTSAARGLLELRHTLEKIICHNSTDALRHVFASRIAEIKDSPVWNRLSFVSCARNGLLLMDESLQLLPVVETLDLSRNKFAKVDNLRKCTRLKHLDLGFNQVRTITSFSEVSSQLVKLVLRNNALTTLRGIENLKCLEGLDLSYNVISNFSELEVLAGLPSLLSLWLEGNPLCCARWYRAQVFSIFLYPDKLRLDDKKISTREFWKIQIIIASRQKQPASFGFYAPAKGDAEVDGTMNTKRKKHSRLACIESEEQVIHTNSDEESIVCENETHSKVEEIISDEEIEVDLVKRIERMKKERSALWLQEFKEWLIQDSENCLNTNNFTMPALNVDNNNLKHKAKHSYHGESSRYVSDTVQASGDWSSTNMLESDSSFADHSSVFNAHQYFDGIIEPVPNFSMRYTCGNPVPVDSTDVKQEQMKPMDEGYISARAGNRHPHLFVVPRGERKQKEISIAPSNATVSTYASPGSPPHYQKDILHRRHNLEEEYLQLSAESFSVASSDSNTSCNEDDFTEFGPFIPEGDLSLIEELSERSSHSTLRNSEDMQYHKGNGVSEVAQNGVCISDSIAVPSSSVLRLRDQNNVLSDEHDSKVVHCMKQEDNWLGKKSSYRKPKRRLISLLEENDNMVKKCEEVSSLNGDIGFCVNNIKDKQQRPIHYGGQICVMDTTTSFTDGGISISCPKSSLLGIEDIIEDYFNTEFADRGVNETCRTCICCNCMIEHKTEYREGEVAVLLSSEYKLYVMLLDINHDGSEIRLSIMDCHKIEDVRRVLVGLGLQFLRVYFENGGTYLFITRSVDKSRQLLCLLHCLDSELGKQYCSTESVEQVQVELFQRDICGVLRMSMFQYAMVLFWCNNMEEDIWLSRSLFVLEQHLLVCVEDFMKSGSCRIDPSPYFSLSSVCSIIDVIEMVIDTREGWCITLAIESATSEFCFLKKMEESAALTTKRTASCSLKWKLKWFSEKGLFNFVAVLKALYAGVANSSSPLIVKCIS